MELLKLETPVSASEESMLRKLASDAFLVSRDSSSLDESTFLARLASTLSKGPGALGRSRSSRLSLLSPCSSSPSRARSRTAPSSRYRSISSSRRSLSCSAKSARCWRTPSSQHSSSGGEPTPTLPSATCPSRGDSTRGGTALPRPGRDGLWSALRTTGDSWPGVACAACAACQQKNLSEQSLTTVGNFKIFNVI